VCRVSEQRLLEQGNGHVRSFSEIFARPLDFTAPWSVNVRSSGAPPGRGLPMATNHPIHRHTGHTAASSSRQQTCRQRPVVLMSPRYVDLDDAHEQAALGALADLLAPYLQGPVTDEEECA
jgi:hypothetical protein